MIHLVTVDTSREATALRVEHVCLATYQALLRGLVTADHLHETAGWNPEADIHLHRQMTRREAMEELKQLGPALEDDDNLGLAMSGLILELPEDIIRVWHTVEDFIPTPRSRAGLQFVTQRVERPSLFVLGGLQYDAPPDKKRNSLIIQWTAQGQQILRFDLVRPCGYEGGKVAVDWRVPLLTTYSAMPDIQYRLREDDVENDETEDM